MRCLDPTAPVGTKHPFTFHSVRCGAAMPPASCPLGSMVWRVWMKIIAYDRFRPGVDMETIEPYIKEEVANVWRLWKAGTVRENYARADQNGVVIVFECSDVEEVKRYVGDFPLSKA